MSSEARRPSLKDQLIELIAEKQMIALKSITGESTFYQMGIDGDDAMELLEEYSEKFKVDMSEFKCSRYIGPEGIPLGILFGSWEHPDRDLTVDMLVRAAEAHKWIES